MNSLDTLKGLGLGCAYLSIQEQRQRDYDPLMLKLTEEDQVLYNGRAKLSFQILPFHYKGSIGEDPNSRQKRLTSHIFVIYRTRNWILLSASSHIMSVYWLS